MGAPTQEQLDQIKDAQRNPAQTVEQSRDTTRVTYRPYAELAQMAAQAEAELATATSTAKPLRLLRARILHGTEGAA